MKLRESRLLAGGFTPLWFCAACVLGIMGGVRLDAAESSALPAPSRPTISESAEAVIKSGALGFDTLLLM